MVSDKGLSIASMHKLCKKAGAERVSESATKEMAKVLEEIGIKIGKEALDFAIHAGRRTVKGRDIKISARKVMSQR